MADLGAVLNTLDEMLNEGKQLIESYLTMLSAQLLRISIANRRDGRRRLFLQRRRSRWRSLKTTELYSKDSCCFYCS